MTVSVLSYLNLETVLEVYSADASPETWVTFLTPHKLKLGVHTWNPG